MADLKTLALKLTTQGPHKILPTPRQISILFGGHYLTKTTSAQFVWEHPFYPQYYIPATAIKASPNSQLTPLTNGEIKDDSGTVVATQHTLTTTTPTKKTTDRIILFSKDLTGPAAPLADLYRFEFAAMDTWLEESAPIFVHPKDPFKRIDILPSTRPIKIFLNGVCVASSNSSMHLHETGLPTRYYLPLTAVTDMSVLRKSATKTQCPYKGESSYYDIVLNGKETKDVVWYYDTPTLESALVAGLVCFYDEKVDYVELDGERMAKPETPWSKKK